MAAYSAAVSLEQLLSELLNSNHLPKEEVVCLHGKICSLKSSLEKIFPAPKKDRVEANKLAIRIREKIFEAQDTIESFIYFTQNQSPETTKSHSSSPISFEEITANIDPIIEEAKKLSDSIREINRYWKPVVESQTYTLKPKVSGQNNKIVGQEKYKEEIEKKLTVNTYSRLVIPICGMAGIGKTTLAKSIYNDVNFMKNFPYKAWVTVSQDDNLEDMLGKLLNTLESRGQKAGEKKYEGNEAKLRVELHQALSKNKYLVVIDDLWDPQIWLRLKTALPDNENKSRVLVTTRRLDVANSVKSSNILEMRPLSFVDSWMLLCNKVFGDDKACPKSLENHGKRIADNCNGLPLSLTVMGGLLSNGSKEPEYWQRISEDTYTATSDTKDDDAYLGILSLSYDNLPCMLKGCFLYMGAFPEDSDIPVSKLIMLWVAEGFITAPQPQPQPQLSLEKIAEESLLGLISRNLLVVRKIGSDGRVKVCGMHGTLWNFAKKESQRERFFHSIKTLVQEVEEGTNSQRRVCVHNSILMCDREVYDSTKAITKARSLLYLGPSYNHPMPYNLIFVLLRVLDAYTVFFLEFPDEILNLVRLRYLSFTYNGDLPSTLSRLHKLQVLIVKREPICIYVGTSFLPDEFWNMKELRHLIITETDLPPLLSSTEPGSILLENLQTLSNVNATSCTPEVLEQMPNLKRLVMWVEAPGKVGLHLNKLGQLEVFKLTVLDPIPGKGIEFQPRLFFPDTVKKLNLSGCGLPWEAMEVIAKLPNLEVLKLKEFAFRGDEWCPNNKFKKLKFLLIEYLRLKRWEADDCCYHFPKLEQLILRHCYDLEELPSGMGELALLRLIELVDCCPGAVEWAEDIKTEQEVYRNERLQICIYSSCE